MEKTVWEYYFARKFSLQRFQIVMNVFISPFYKQHFNVHIRNILVKSQGDGNYGIYVPSKELFRMQKRIFNVVCKDLEYFYYYKRMIKKVQARWIAAASYAASQTNPHISHRSLLRLYKLFVHHHQEHFNKPIWIPFPIESLLAEAAQHALRTALRRARRENEYDQWARIVFSPEEQNAISKAQEAVLALAVQIKKQRLAKTHIREALERITVHHGFIPCYDVIDAPWDSDHFDEELKKYLTQSSASLVVQLNDIQSRFKQARLDFQKFLHSVPLRKRERELCIMAHELIFIKDERDDYRRKGSYYGRKLFLEIGRRFGIGDRGAAYLTITEVCELLQKGATPPGLRARVQERMQGYVLLWKNRGPLVVMSGAEMQKKLAEEFPLSHAKETQTKITGTVGMTGTVRGKVVIVHTKHDLRHIFDGAIMVALTTNPDYVPAMKRCAAIVTDEGGITSHAAIVSRELNIPCIVGTKVATQIFKNGDIVEVGVENGIVKKI